MISFKGSAGVNKQNFICHSPNDKYVIETTHETLTFIEENYKDNGAVGAKRQLASSLNVKTVLIMDGFTKTASREGKQFIVGIKDQNNPSENTDYLIIRDQEGHELLYPLTCQI